MGTTGALDEGGCFVLWGVCVRAGLSLEASIDKENGQLQLWTSFFFLLSQSFCFPGFNVLHF
jgi:hypothetical protein